MPLLPSFAPSCVSPRASVAPTAERSSSSPSGGGRCAAGPCDERGTSPCNREVFIRHLKTSPKLLRSGRSCGNLSPVSLHPRAAPWRLPSRSRQFRARRRINGQTVRGFEIICEEVGTFHHPPPRDGRHPPRIETRQKESNHGYQDRIGACFGDDRIGQRPCICQPASYLAGGGQLPGGFGVRPNLGMGLRMNRTTPPVLSLHTHLNGE